MNIIGSYINGNYSVQIFNDGTKIRETEGDSFIPDFPESMDLKITNQCDMGCPYCHENSTKDGLHGDVLNAKFIDTLRPFTEIAIGGGNVLSHPDLIPFLKRLKCKNIIANATVNQEHFMNSIDVIKQLVDDDLIKGLGVSLVNPTEEFVSTIQQFPNAVIHVINGVINPSELLKLYDKDLKILILGYKEFRRGETYYNSNIGKVTYNKLWLSNKLTEALKHFKVVSFDNLAIRQLDVKRLLTPEKWDEFYMGDDGSATMYIDLVKEEFAVSSTSTKRHDLMDNIDNMFEFIRS